MQTQNTAALSGSASQPTAGQSGTRKTAELRLKGPKALPRTLAIRWVGHTCNACLFFQEPFVMAAYGSTSEAGEARLVLDHEPPELWLGGAAFDLTHEEAQLVRSTFEPVGLLVQEALAPLGTGPLEPDVAPQTDESDLDEDERRCRSGDRRSDSERAHDDAGVSRLFR